MPNGVNLSGNYDWFYEGFALYQALKTGVAVNRIRFTDFLDTLARAYNVDSGHTQRPSLIDASKSRWSGANTQVYARGMLVAFICDITLLQASKGKRSVSDIFRDIYLAHSGASARADGNTVVLSTLEKYGLKTVADRYIRGSENIAWKTELDRVGIETEDVNLLTRLKVKEKPSGRQKAFLDKLGYNNWRKMSRN
jgi:predicted metalloprotease with PDZ domain